LGFRYLPPSTYHLVPARGEPRNLSTSTKESSIQITKTVRLTGSSPDSIEDAVRTVLARAAATIADIERWDMVRAGGRVDDSGVPTEFEVTVDITFAIRDSVEHG
jgi:flavin-binding protein dodecin